MKYYLVTILAACWIAFTGAGCSKSPIKFLTRNTTASAQNHFATKSEDTLLTEKDFTGWGLSQKETINQQEDTFRVQINLDEPVYTFHVVSFATSTATPGKIEIFRGDDLTHPTQTLPLDPNVYVANEIPWFFNVKDIDFDGYADIGVAADGGAQWGSWQYWVFDPKTGTFVESSFTKEFRRISFNEIAFDGSTKRIITTNLLGAVGGSKEMYEVQKGHLVLLQEETEENIDATHCKTTSKESVHGKMIERSKTRAQLCSSAFDTSENFDF